MTDTARNDERRARRVLLIGPRPPPIHGQSAAFELLVRGLSASAWSSVVIDTAEKSGERRSGAFSATRALEALRIVIRACLRVPTVELVYVPISQSLLGFLKDALILLTARAFCRPTVVHLHGGNFQAFYEALSGVGQWFVRAALKRASRFVVLGESLRPCFSMVASAATRTVVVPNACEFPIQRPRAAPTSRVRILYLSNLIVQKGYLDVLDSMERLRRLVPDVAIDFDLAGLFVLAADRYPSIEEMQHDFERRRKLLAPVARVTWHGPVFGEAKAALLKGADIFVLPTYYSNEGQPIAIIESLAAGLPVVTTEYRSIPELLPPEMRRCFVPPRDPAAIADRIAELIRAPRLYEALSRAAIAQAGQFTPAVHLGRMARVLEEAVTGNVATPD